MMTTTETYSFGIRTLQRAYEVIENGLSADFLSLCEKPRPRMYRNKNGERRYKIVIDVDHGHWDPATDIAAP